MQNSLPKSWRWVKLGEVCEFEYGSGLPDRDRVKGLVAVYGSNGIVGYHSRAITKGRTVIIGRKGSIGQANFSESSCWPIDTTYYIDSSKTQCDLIWLYWLIKWLRLDLLNKATGVPGLNREDAYSQLIPLPPIQDQHRIAAKIQKLMQEVERAKSAFEKQLGAAKAMPSAYLRQVFESKEAMKWERMRIDECISSKKRIKIKGILQKNYKKEGKFPIVDQGRSLICGFTDDKSSIYQGDLPVIIFGDHTRLFKYVDFPFAIGADGTKIISPNADLLIPKFFYFTLMSYDIKNLGYSRHYKLLRNISIPVPDFKTQRKVISGLEKKISGTENLQSTIRNQQSTIDAFPQVILRKAFTGGL